MIAISEDITEQKQEALYAAQIQQYFANIARGQPATAPKMPGGR